MLSDGFTFASLNLYLLIYRLDFFLAFRMPGPSDVDDFNITRKYLIVS